MRSLLSPDKQGICSNEDSNLWQKQLDMGMIHVIQTQTNGLI